MLGCLPLKMLYFVLYIMNFRRDIFLLLNKTYQLFVIFFISGIRPHAVRKRTPRVPISYSIGKDIGERFFSSVRQGSKQMVDTNDVTHKIALALTEASQRGGSSKNSGSPDKNFFPSPVLKSGKKVISYFYKTISCLFLLFSCNE